MAINKTIFFIIGVLLVILGAFMLIPYIVQMIYDENSHSFLSSAFVTIFIGVLFILANLDQDYKLNLQQTFLFSSLAWIAAALFGSLPFHLSVLELSFSEAFFESMSGITTTGSTVINDLDNSPKSILIWRAIMQWLGGIGIIVMAITVLPLLKVGGMQLFKMEGSDSTEKILPRTVEVASIIILTYLLLTFSCATLYWMFDMSVFDSIAHSMTTIATGGFSTHNNSIEYFKSSNIEIIATVFIILGSIPFISYLKFIKGNRKIFFSDVQIRGFVYLIVLSILAMFLYLFFSNNEISLIDKLRISSFNVVSILSGTGYVTDDFGLWGEFPLIFFLFLMFVGGCAGSTTCGIKIFRFQLLYIFIGNQIKKLFYPNSISVIKYNNQKISNNFIHSIIIFIFSYLFLFLLLAILLSITGLDFLSAISGAATSISNVGPGLGEMIGPNGNFKEVSDISKWLLSFGMLLGRLELFAVLVLFFPSFWKD
ncbi:MAG: potassium transporter TrkH [Pelagibacterales bacterium MED-G40]|nr:MAG: potassium transporter TrkH [Candidatus Pelagibacter sp. TMED203]PDH20426.1 MAG: potassium transporter TrkH [Pelagibacterales bacterium MED-G40]|tara:strand:- start:24437 stop:25885 length:1449 start_codon:yes stop_codon:yes gene_type:complete